MQISKEIGGFSGRAPTTCARRSARRTARRWRKLEPEFREGCRASGTSEQVIDWLWTTNEKSADYSFNRSHAACYALIAYRTAWLKANYPAEYMAALISSVMDTKDKVPFFANQAESMGIEILPPDVNLSDHEFVVDDGNIRFGLDAVKGVGYAAVEAIKAARAEGGHFESIWDFCARVDARAVNKKAIEALVKCGAFGSTGASRKGMLSVLEQAQAAGQKTQQDAQIGQGSIFDGLFDRPPARRRHRRRERRDGGVRRAPAPADPVRGVRPARAAGDREGVDRPVHLRAPAQAGARGAARRGWTAALAELAERKDGDWVTAGGIITQAKKIRTRNGDHMMFATLDDLEGSVEVIVFGKALGGVRGRAGRRLGRPRARPRRPQGGDEDVARGADRRAASSRRRRRSRRPSARRAHAPVGPPPLTLRLDAARLPASAIDDLKDLLGSFPGESEVVLELLLSAGDPRTLRLGNAFKVAPTPTLRAELEQILGPAVVRAPAAAAPTAAA